MRWIIILILALSLRASAMTNIGCTVDSNTTVVASQSCTLSSPGVANQIQLVFLAYPTATTTTLTDTYVLSYTSWAVQTFTGPSYTTEVRCGFTGSNSGSETITAHYSPSENFVYMGVMERTDVTYSSCAAAFDIFGAGLGVGKGSGTGTTLSTTNATTTNTNDIAVGFGVTGGAANTLSVGSGYSNIPFVPVGAATPALPEFQTVTSAGTSLNATETDGTSSGWGIVMVLMCPGNCVNANHRRAWVIQR